MSEQQRIERQDTDPPVGAVLIVDGQYIHRHANEHWLHIPHVLRFARTLAQLPIVQQHWYDGHDVPQRVIDNVQQLDFVFHTLAGNCLDLSHIPYTCTEIVLVSHSEHPLCCAAAEGQTLCLVQFPAVATDCGACVCNSRPTLASCKRIQIPVNDKTLRNTPPGPRSVHRQKPAQRGKLRSTTPVDEEGVPKALHGEEAKKRYGLLDGADCTQELPPATQEGKAADKEEPTPPVGMEGQEPQHQPRLESEAKAEWEQSGCAASSAAETHEVASVSNPVACR
eukprot:TRINITY_DN14991_c0_g1_i1.p2 TRINITY_DN14991_c0_g1~~TRINITY_DN14991_c0_g1_i1.p2  ORF type:complete len:281 (-),score=2.70 TRINITY_DN14991_c0_g1_i1:388-1230(-)